MTDPKTEAIDSLKALAEMTFIFFKHLLATGATISEASAMTSAYIQAILTSGRNNTGAGEQK